MTCGSSEFTNYICLFSFSGTNGAAPYGDLIEGTDGRLYGVTIQGGLTNATFPQGQGTAFSLKKDGSGFALLHCFGSTNCDGQSPSAALLEDKANGMLYGTTMYGGISNAGTIFRLNKDGSDFSVIMNFTDQPTDGAYPQGGLLKGSDAVLYGTACFGDPSGVGLLFRIDENGSDYQLLCPLNDGYGDIADSPAGSLIEGTNGCLYGVGLTGWMSWDVTGEINSHGAIFRVNKDGTAFAANTVAFFTSRGRPYMQPNGPLLDSGDGYLYGTTLYSRTLPGGSVFRVSIGDYWDFTILAEGGPVFQPLGGLIKGPDANLYGTASARVASFPGSVSYGDIFELDTSGSNVNTIKEFSSSPDGANPQGRLVLASDGGMYGVTGGGGGSGYGTIFGLFTDARSWFANITHNTNNTLSLHAFGVAGAAFRLQSATNSSFPIWNDVTTNKSGVVGTVDFNNIATAASNCFYRLVTP